MNQRAFTQLSAWTFAWTLLPSYARTAGASQKPVGYAAIGLGTVSDIFMRACAKPAAMYGIPESSVYTYEPFARILENKDVNVTL